MAEAVKVIGATRRCLEGKVRQWSADVEGAVRDMPDQAASLAHQASRATQSLFDQDTRDNLHLVRQAWPFWPRWVWPISVETQSSTYAEFLARIDSASLPISALIAVASGSFRAKANRLRTSGILYEEVFMSPRFPIFASSSEARTATLQSLLIAAIVITGLYVAREVLLPLALAIVLSFVLTPALLFLRRLKVPRVVGVAIVVAFAFALIFGLGWLMSQQATQLAGDLPAISTCLPKKSVRFANRLPDRQPLRRPPKR